MPPPIPTVGKENAKSLFDEAEKANADSSGARALELYKMFISTDSTDRTLTFIARATSCTNRHIC